MQRIAVVGGGPAGSYFTWDLAGRRPDLTIDLFECNASRPGAGLAIEERVLSQFPGAFGELRASVQRWNRILVRANRREVWSGGHDIIGVSRRALADHLLALAGGRSNVNVCRATVHTPPAGYDLVVAADGWSSRVRPAEDFGTRATEGRMVYSWLSSPVCLPAMFVLLSLPGGVLTIHAYPHAANESTLVAETDPLVLAENGLLEQNRSETERRLAGLLHDVLGGALVRAHTHPWRPFTTITNQQWRAGNLVLLGDAARTIHFSAGSGTALALADAQSLAGAVASSQLERYEQERRPVVDHAQDDAAASMRWFEQLSHRQDLGSRQLVFALRTRRDVNSFSSLRKRDPDFVTVACQRDGTSGLP